jgi:hypothetical protein
MLNNAEALFDRMPKTVEKKIIKLEDDLKRKDQIIAVVTEEALELKKISWGVGLIYSIR